MSFRKIWGYMTRQIYCSHCIQDIVFFGGDRTLAVADLFTVSVRLCSEYIL